MFLRKRKNEFQIFMNFFKQSHWHDKMKSRKQQQINEHDLFWLIKKPFENSAFVFRKTQLDNYVFSGGDNKIGVAVRKPDGSVALPYKWQVIQKKGYISCSSDVNNQFWIYKFWISLFNFKRKPGKQMFSKNIQDL